MRVVNYFLSFSINNLHILLHYISVSCSKIINHCNERKYLKEGVDRFKHRSQLHYYMQIFDYYFDYHLYRVNQGHINDLWDTYVAFNLLNYIIGVGE